MSWSYYPIGTKAHSVTGGHWKRVEGGWKWSTGDTFPTPGGGVSRIELPANTFKCHFKKMDYEWGDNGNGGTEEFYVCSVCGCTKDTYGRKIKQQ